MVRKKIDYLASLNEVQRAAVESMEGAVMVIAGPGSGKTRVLTYRIAYLIENGIEPWRILALTFTNKAASEMKERIEQVVGPGARKVWMGTFHSIFARILRVEGHRLGYPNDFTIYDTDDSKNLIKDIINSMQLDPKVYKPGVVLSRISMAKSNLITPKRYANNDDLMVYDRMNRVPMIFQIYEKYTERCLRAGAMDFDDLLLQMFRLLYQNPDNVREKYNLAFSHILVDEFQDTNSLQYEIIKLFLDPNRENPNICIVGDDAQSIYSFRGATIDNILNFEKDFPQLQVFKLEQNYRSTKHIIGAANKVITNNDRQIQKKIWTEELEGHKIKLIKTVTDTEEGKRIADLIVEYKNRFHVKNSDMAILYRTNAQSRIFEEHLRRLNLPYKIYGGLSFYQRKEVKDVVAYMRLTINPLDDEAFKRVINFPKRGLGGVALNSIFMKAEQANISLYHACFETELSPKAKNAVNEFIRLIESFMQKNQESNAYETASYIVKKTGIMEVFKAENTLEAFGRMENINSLLDGVQEFVENDEFTEGEPVERNLSGYLQNIALLTDFDQKEEETDFVTLMSVHSAKGLEFDCIFVVGLEENLFPSYMSLSIPEQIDEERRLFYVAITRAKRFLVLSYANSRYQYGEIRMNDPSRFIEEIPIEHLEDNSPIKQKLILDKPKILGGIKPLDKKPVNDYSKEAQNFIPDHPDKIEENMRILHLKFGPGTITGIEGYKENRIARIDFDNLEGPEKRIVLKYAKLKILQ
ncbi:MAG TPA: ATP-dependent DNA helicase [Saprospirales bacterium]|nr:ATP-dependent DNA helicase [Saprospirales bacterium]HAY70810.1 ATP-dependent DNA helicase [Saprospirales bacterium]HRQ30110.1 3'-5' exonuclease [Saprospiraceae bacterium]